MAGWVPMRGAVQAAVPLPDEGPAFPAMLAPVVEPVPVLAFFAVLAAGLYLLGVWRLRRRGWPWWRTACFVVGCAIVVLLTGTRVDLYGFRMLSVFMFQQLTLMFAVPPLLVLGEPIAVLLAALPSTGRGRAGRRVLLRVLRGRVARFLFHPAPGLVLFLAAFYGLYFSRAADVLLSAWWPHVALEAVLLASGTLFTLPLLSSGPLPVRMTPAGRLVDLLVEMPLHAFFGVFMMIAKVAFVPVMTTAPATWGVDPIADQGVAGGLAWSYGELPGLLLVLLLLRRWSRHDTGRARARDRLVDQRGDEELDRYNAHLARLHSTDPTYEPDRPPER